MYGFWTVLAGFSATPVFEMPFWVVAKEAPILAEEGYAAPLYEDIDGDGKRELLVGQFGDGKLRVYPNYGTDTCPQFKDFTFLKAGEEDAAVHAG